MVMKYQINLIQSKNPTEHHLEKKLHTCQLIKNNNMKVPESESDASESDERLETKACVWPFSSFSVFIEAVLHVVVIDV